MDAARPRPSAGRVHAPRLADVVAERIRDAILLGELADGERLPPVETLLEQFGVSAPSMREALRVLEAEGLIVVQRGGIGGAVVNRPTAKTAAYTLALVLRSQGTPKSDVSRATTMLEPLCAQLCAQRADRKKTVVPVLRELNATARALVDDDDGVRFNAAMLEFHRTLVRLSGNETMTLVTQALEHIRLAEVQAWVSTNAAHGTYPTADLRRREVDFHERITDLVAKGDDAAVAVAMTEHLADGVAADLARPGETVDPKSVRLSPGRD
jgi:GntR family transcriptional repressor for pyruvate dehydrogenase complex